VSWVPGLHSPTEHNETITRSRCMMQDGGDLCERAMVERCICWPRRSQGGGARRPGVQRPERARLVPELRWVVGTWFIAIVRFRVDNPFLIWAGRWPCFLGNVSQDIRGDTQNRPFRVRALKTSPPWCSRE
jgi:hypothetical protein